MSDSLPKQHNELTIIGEFNVDAGQGGAFGLATSGFVFNFAAVDANTNSIWVLSLGRGESPFASGDY